MAADEFIPEAPVPIDMTEADHVALNRTLDRILAAYRDGDCDMGEARSALAHMMGAVAFGNEAEFRAWLTSGPVSRYLETTRAAKDRKTTARTAAWAPDHPTAQ